MYFFDRNEAFADNIMCIDDNKMSYTYREIWDMGDELTAHVEECTLQILQCSNNAKDLSIYLALLRKRCPVLLLGKSIGEETLKKFKDSYGGVKDVHPDLALLLSTSGSTGEQKLVRLSYKNLQSNCEAIVKYLKLTAGERPITTLPMEYTYGLSVIHSHIAVGATIVLTEHTLFDREFWESFEDNKVTSMAGVPYTYEMFKRLRLQRMDMPYLKTLTQAGGHLSEELQEDFALWAKEKGIRFFVMYGQTEATARMSYIPPERCMEKIGSIGIPVPGGHMELKEDGEIIYYGDNVSMGYAACMKDLSKGDDNHGRLATGDVAYMDEDGYYYITGRKKRFVKIYGKRFSLDQIQEYLREELGEGEIACTGTDEGITVWAACGAEREEKCLEQILNIFNKEWGIKENLIEVKLIEKLPRNESGKILYKELDKGLYGAK